MTEGRAINHLSRPYSVKERGETSWSEIGVVKEGKKR
jgi:hypothetical protein